LRCLRVTTEGGGTSRADARRPGELRFQRECYLPGWKTGLDAHLARRPELAGDPAHGVSFQRVDREANLVGAMARPALEDTLLKSPFARRNPSQSHPVFAGGTHRPLNNGITHHPPPKREDIRDEKCRSVRSPTLRQNFVGRSAVSDGLIGLSGADQSRRIGNGNWMSL
jgi:hypothetical protein